MIFKLKTFKKLKGLYGIMTNAFLVREFLCWWFLVWKLGFQDLGFKNVFNEFYDRTGTLLAK